MFFICVSYTHDEQVYGQKIYDNCNCSYCGNDSYNLYKAKTMTQPKVVWVNDWQHFVIFYVALQDEADAWKIAYIVSSDSQGNFSSDPAVHYLDLKSNWNPMAINCNQRYGTNKKACLLVFNEIQTDYNPNYPDYVARTTFKILEPREMGEFQVYNLIKSGGDWTRKGYGHYSLAHRYLSYSTTTTVNVLNRITKSDQELANSLMFYIRRSPYGGGWYGENLSESNSDSSGFYSRTGYSLVFNPDKNIFKYLWIKE